MSSDGKPGEGKTNPGATAFTNTPRLTTSRARALVAPIKPAFAAE